MKKLLIILSLCVCASITSGCDASVLAGEWGQLSSVRDDVRYVKEGMRTFEVLNKLGQPKDITSGEDVYIGWQVWQYPTGDVYFYRGGVKKIYVKPLTTAEFAAIKKGQKSYWDNFKFEGDREENQESELEKQLKDTKNIWSPKSTDIASRKKMSDYPEGMLK